MLIFFIFSSKITFSDEVLLPVLDLSKKNFDGNETYSLSTKWRFYWKKLINTSDELQNFEYQLVDVPSSWDEHESKNVSLPGFGYASYYLKIILPPNRPDTLAIKSRRIKMASNIIVNNKLVSKIGLVSDGSLNSSTGHRPRITLIHLDEGTNTIDLIIQVSNFSYPRGGLTGALLIGSADSIYHNRASNLNLEFWFFGALFIISLYHVVIWFKRRGDFSALLFSAFCLLMGFRQMLTGEKYILNFFPSLNDRTLLVLEFSSIFWAIPILHIFVSNLFNKEFWQPLKWLSILFLAFEILKTIFLPLYMYSAIVVPTEIYIIFVLGHISYVGFKALLNKRIGAGIFFVGIVLFFMLGINDILHERGVINTAFLATWGAVTFVFAQASVLSFRFSEDFIELTNLKKDLESKVAMRTHQLEEAKNHAQNLAQENRRLSIHTVDILEEERKLIATEMHDSFGNTFVTIRLHLESIISMTKNTDIIEIAATLKSLVSDRYELVRNIVRRIRPEILNTLGLCGAISELVRTQNISNNIIFTNLNCGNLSLIPEQMALGIYRITQEAITNIVKHSRANKAEINLNIDDKVELSIIDDGSGFDLSTNNEGVGLISIRERVYSFGGDLKIITKKGYGVEIRIIIPLTKSNT